MNANRIAAVAAAIALTMPAGALAQSSPLQGTWEFVSITNIDKDGKRTPGNTRRGLYVFTPEGRYMSMLSNGNAAPFASKSRNTGTAEENKAAVLDSISHFGTYTVDPGAGTFTMKVEACSFPNWTGTQLVRTYKVDGDTILLANAQTSANTGGSNEIVIRRVK